MTYPGGATTFVLASAAALARRGHQIVVVGQRFDDALVGECEGVRFVSIGGPAPKSLRHPLALPALVGRVAKIIRTERPAVVFPQVFPANHWALLAKSRTATPQVWYCHDVGGFLQGAGYVDTLRNPLRTLAKVAQPLVRQVDKRLVARADGVVTNSRFTADYVQRQYATEATVVPPGVDSQWFQPSSAPREGGLCVAHWTPYKGLERAVAAWAIVVREFAPSPPTLTVVGGGDTREAQTLARQLGISNHVAFLGPVDKANLLQCYQECAVFIHPTSGEPFGLAPLEAMASGAPTIVTSPGGPCEIVDHGHTGFIVPEEHEELARAAIALLRDDRVARSVSEAGVRRARSVYSWDACAQGLEQALLRES